MQMNKHFQQHHIKKTYLQYQTLNVDIFRILSALTLWATVATRSV
jgi:hypothetical protein